MMFFVHRKFYYLNVSCISFQIEQNINACVFDLPENIDLGASDISCEIFFDAILKIKNFFYAFIALEDSLLDSTEIFHI